MTAPPSLAIVIPCYNEQEVLPETRQRMVALLQRLTGAGKIAANSRVWFVDDGSRDATWSMIEGYAAADPRIAGIKLSRNRGHQNALLAGLFTAEGDIVVSIDADLQDDIEAIEAMVDRYREGAEIVYGVRQRRDADTLFKKMTALGFYRLLSALGAESVANHADYRLMSRRAIECLKQYREVNLYLRGIVPLLGFRSAIVHYDRAARFAGESKYPLGKMVRLALEAVTSFSVVAVPFVTVIGFAVFFGTMAVSLWALWARFFTDAAVPGWTSVVLPMYFLGGIQILCIGIIGEYLGKAYAEAKARPRYLIEKVVPAAPGGEVRR